MNSSSWIVSIILRNLPLNFTHKCTSSQSQSVFFVEWLSIKRSGVKQFHSLIARPQRLKKTYLLIFLPALFSFGSHITNTSNFLSVGLDTTWDCMVKWPLEEVFPACKMTAKAFLCSAVVIVTMRPGERARWPCGDECIAALWEKIMTLLYFVHLWIYTICLQTGQCNYQTPLKY